jgi:RHS repeat-associated protein
VTTNGIAQNRTHGPTHELLTAGGSSVVTDVKGNMTTLPAVLSGLQPPASSLSLSCDIDNKLTSADIDANGNMTRRTLKSDNSYIEYTYDHRDRLTDVRYRNSAGTLTKRVHFGYDALNRRYLQTVENGSGTILSTVYYVNQGFRKDRGDAGDEIALRLDGTGSVISRYLHGSLVDEVLAEENIGSGGVRDVLWAMTDHQGSVRDLARVTAGTASVVNHIVYDAFGKTVSETDTAIAHLYGYTGRELDKETGLQYNRARYLDLALARFISQDPIGFAAGDANLYRYVGNKPTMATDPSGLWEEPSKSQQPFYLFPWSEFPGHVPGDGVVNGLLIEGPDGEGQRAFQSWVVNDPARARRFFDKFESQWGDLIRHASKANDTPEGVAMAFVFSEIVNFRWNDYHDFGKTRGPGQLSNASIEYYGTRQRWEERPNGIETDRGQIFVSQVRSLASLGQLHVPNYAKRSDEVYLIQQMYYVTWILSMQAKELALAARGGGTLQTSGGRSINVAPMSPDLLSTDRMAPYLTPPVGVDFHKNLGRLAIMLSQMNRHHPRATGGQEKMLYEGPYSPASPQANFLEFMFSNGYFTCDDGKLKANF